MEAALLKQFIQHAIHNTQGNFLNKTENTGNLIFEILWELCNDNKGHGKKSPKLVKMSVLFIKINFSQRYVLFSPRNKVIVVLKLALLQSRMDKYTTALIGNLQKNSECAVIFDKHSSWLNLTCIANSILSLLKCKIIYCAAYNCSNGSASRWSMHSFPPKQDLHQQALRKTLRTVSLSFNHLWHDQLDMTWRVSGWQMMTMMIDVLRPLLCTWQAKWAERPQR